MSVPTRQPVSRSRPYPAGGSDDTASKRRQAGRHWLARSRRRLILICFILPSLAYVAVFFVYPLVYGTIMSLEDYNFQAIVKGGGSFVGLANYSTELSSPTTHLVIENTAVFLVASIVLQFIIGLGIAVYFNRRFFLSRLLRSLILVPWLFPSVAVGLIFQLLFSGESGFVNTFLLNLHLISKPVYWLDSSLLAMLVVTVANVWAGIPFNAVLLYAALQNVPHELLEAAMIDGAGAWKRFRHITMPFLRPVSLIVIMLGIVYTVKVFDLIIVITAGGPDNGTQLLSTWAYQLAFTDLNFGQGAAVGNIVLIFCLFMAMLYIRAVRKEAFQ
jgi:multiple sugar transport system permease protein